MVVACPYDPYDVRESESDVEEKDDCSYVDEDGIVKPLCLGVSDRSTKRI